MTPEEWLDRLRASLPDGDHLTLSDGESEALLDLARIAAHTSERSAAPLTTFLVGAAIGHQPAPEREAALRSLVTDLEVEG